MSAALVLAAFAAATAALAPRHLLHAGWVQRPPSWGIWAWQAVLLTVAMATFLIGVTLALPILPVGPRLTGLVQTTHLDVTEHHETPAGNWLAGLALAGATVLAVRAVGLLWNNMRAAGQVRRGQLDTLALIGRQHPDGFTLVEHAIPLVYSLPGRRRTIVVTGAALDALSDEELRSVLAHERIHLRTRHDLALAATDALARTFSIVPLFRVAHEQVAALIEMQADDAVRDYSARNAMARALVALGTTVSPTPASTACGAPSGAVTRVHRLVGGSGPARAHQRLAVGACTVALMSTPVALALVPVVEASAHDCCHAALPHEQPTGSTK